MLRSHLKKKEKSAASIVPVGGEERGVFSFPGPKKKKSAREGERRFTKDRVSHRLHQKGSVSGGKLRGLLRGKKRRGTIASNEERGKRKRFVGSAKKKKKL